MITSLARARNIALHGILAVSIAERMIELRAKRFGFDFYFGNSCPFEDAEEIIAMVRAFDRASEVASSVIGHHTLEDASP